MPRFGQGNKSVGYEDAERLAARAQIAENKKQIAENKRQIKFLFRLRAISNRVEKMRRRGDVEAAEKWLAQAKAILEDRRKRSPVRFAIEIADLQARLHSIR